MLTTGVAAHRGVSSVGVGGPGVIGRANLSLDRIVASLGLTPALVLDAGEGASYSSGQTWTDLSGNSRSFQRGATSGSSTDDPTFNGVPGGLSSREYFSFDGGDFFLKSSANDAFFNGLHKDNAAHTFVFIVRYPTVTASTRLLCTARLGADIGIRYFVDASSKLTITTNNAAGFQTQHTSTASVPGNSAIFLAVSYSEGGGASGSFVNINGTVETFNAAVTSPSASDATRTASLFAHENGTSAVENGFRAFGVLGFASALSQSQVAALRSRIMTRVS